jgi:hypothetical protein
MNDNSTPEATDLLLKFKAVPDIRSRVAIVALMLICLFLPIGSSSAFGIGASFGLDNEAVLGSWAYWLTLVSVGCVIAPAFDGTKSATRVIDIFMGAGAILAAIVVFAAFVRGYSEIAMAGAGSRALFGRSADVSGFVSFGPHFGVAPFVVLVVLAAIRGLKALRANPTVVAA